MPVFHFKHITGDFYFDENAKRAPPAKTMIDPPAEVLSTFLISLKDPSLFPEFHNLNLNAAKEAVHKATGRDQLIVQISSHIDELDKTLNNLSKRFREVFAYYSPEQEHLIRDHHELVLSALAEPREGFLSKHKVAQTMGIDLEKQDIETINTFASMLDSVYTYQQQQDESLKAIMLELAPNITAIAGHKIGAKLITHAGSLQRMAMLPASTIQLLGAEKALFRHIRTGARSPKHGLIIQHPLVAQSREKGKAARILADKISIAAKIDFFKGTFIGDSLRKEVEDKVKK